MKRRLLRHPLDSCPGLVLQACLVLFLSLYISTITATTSTTSIITPTTTQNQAQHIKIRNKSKFNQKQNFHGNPSSASSTFSSSFSSSFSTTTSPNTPSSSSVPLFGKAYIMSTHHRQLSHEDGYLPDQLKSIGFQVLTIPSVKPFQYQFPTMSDLLRYCMHIDHAHDLYPAEIALICSQVFSYDLIANDHDLQEDDWGLVLEDDARLTSRFSPSEVHSMIQQAITAIKQQSLLPLIYLGVKLPLYCHGNYVGDVDTLPNTPFHVNCTGLGGHAYMMTKRLARHLNQDLYLRLNQTKEGREECLHEKCHIDQMLIRRLWKLQLRGGNSSTIVGTKYYQKPTVGVVYACCQQSNGKKVIGGTSLARIPLLPTQTNRCFHMQFSSLSITKQLFQFATMISLCEYHQISPYNCASYTKSISLSPQIPKDKQLTSYFNIPYVNCGLALNQSNIPYQEKSPFSPSTTWLVDEDVFKQDFDTIFKGSFQSLQYFQQVKHFLFVFLQPTASIQQEIQQVYSSVVQTTMSGTNGADGGKGSSVNNDERVLTCLWQQPPSTDDNNGYYEKAMMKVLDISKRNHHQHQKNMSLLIFSEHEDNDKSNHHEKEKARIQEVLLKFPDANIKLIDNDVVHKSFVGKEKSMFRMLFAVSHCQNLILSSSEESWWAGYLSPKKSTKIVSAHWLFAASTLSNEVKTSTEEEIKKSQMWKSIVGDYKLYANNNTSTQQQGSGKASSPRHHHHYLGYFVV